MKRVQLADLVRTAERDVAPGTSHVARQLQIIVELDHRGHEASETRNLLRFFEGTLRIHTDDRDRLVHELASASR